ncbi:MAG: c-type cytochrome [Anaerolineales bacterium]|nr:c-type cytochrome [Anaerolineales bacterium]
MPRQLRFLIASFVFALLAVLATVLRSERVLAQSAAPTATAQPDPLADPVAHGAWLYAGNCQRCHSDYATVRFVMNDPAKTVRAKISGADRQGCEVTWSVARGGPLTGAEIDALLSYMVAWENAGAQPVLPPLPPLPTRAAPTPTPVRSGGRVVRTPTPAPTVEPIDPQLVAAFSGDPVAEGVWLYTRNCQRCHLGYATGRMRQLLDEELVRTTIREGKPATSMPQFGFLLGGPLKSAQIEAILAYMEAWEAQQGEPELPEVVRTAIRAEADKALATLDAMAPDERATMLFETHCAACHGATGEGGTGPALSHPFLGMRPSVTVRDVIANGVAGTEMIAWSQAQKGPLDDRSVDELAALVRDWRSAAAGPAPTPPQPVARSAVSPGPWVLPFALMTAVVYGLTLLLGAIGFWKD